MGIFSRAADRAAALVDKVMAETVRIYRADDGTGNPTAPFDVQGSLVVGADAALSLAGSADVGQTWASRLPSESVEFDVDPVAWPDILTVRAGDAVVALDRGNATYQVLRRKTGERNRIVFILSEA
jgi:hypothetical protein